MNRINDDEKNIIYIPLYSLDELFNCYSPCFAGSNTWVYDNNTYVKKGYFKPYNTLYEVKKDDPIIAKYDGYVENMMKAIKRGLLTYLESQKCIRNLQKQFVEECINGYFEEVYKNV